MTVVKRDQVRPFRDDDGAVIRELAAPSNLGLQRLSVAEIIIKAGQSVSRHYHPEIEEVYHLPANPQILFHPPVCHHSPLRSGALFPNRDSAGHIAQ